MGRDEGEVAAFRPLASGRLLTTALEAVHVELAEQHSRVGAPVGFPNLAILWIDVEAAVEVRLEEDPEDAAAMEFQAEVARFARLGSPESRNWTLEWDEAVRRYRAISRFLARSGLTELRKSDADESETYWDKGALAFR